MLSSKILPQLMSKSGQLDDFLSWILYLCSLKCENGKNECGPGFILRTQNCHGTGHTLSIEQKSSPLQYFKRQYLVIFRKRGYFSNLNIYCERRVWTVKLFRGLFVCLL